MRCNLATTEFISDPSRLSDLLYDERIEISSIKPIARKCDVEVDEGYESDDSTPIKVTTSEKLFMVVYKKKDAFIEEHDTSSVRLIIILYIIMI